MKYLLFLAIGLLVIFPWLVTPGYLILLDWQGTPSSSLLIVEQGAGIAGFPVRLFLFLCSLISPTAGQPLLLLLLLTTAGCGMTRLIKELLPPKIPSLIPITTGLFFTFNWFVYNRLEMGHVYLLGGYALLPYVVSSLRKWAQAPSVRQGIFTSIIGSLVVFTSIHFIILLPLIAALILWDTEYRKRVSRTQLAAVLIPFLISCLLVGGIVVADPSSSLHGIEQGSRALFAPQIQCSRSLILDTTLLVSQWRNPTATHAPCTSPLFLVSSILLLIVIGIGAWERKKLLVGFGIFIVLTIVPLIPPLRDSAKVLALLAFIESLLLGYGMVRLTIRYAISPLLSCILVCVLSYPFLFGLSGTIQTHTYPKSWYTLNEKLSHLPERPVVLFLPWHLYMPFDFTNFASVGNPAAAFFTHATIIQGDNLEMTQGMQRSETQSQRPFSHAIEQVLATRTTPSFSSSFKTLLTDKHISFIALSHGSPEEEEYRTILQKLPYLRPFYEAPGISVWQFGE